MPEIGGILFKNLSYFFTLRMLYVLIHLLSQIKSGKNVL